MNELNSKKCEKTPTLSIPSRESVEWRSKLTGKPTGPIVQEIVFWLTEVEGFSGKEALKLIEEEWAKK